MSHCEICSIEHDGSYGSGRFCSVKCARSSSTKGKRAEINAKVSEKLKARAAEDPNYGFNDPERLKQAYEAKAEKVDRVPVTARYRKIGPLQVTEFVPVRPVSEKPFEALSRERKRERILQEQQSCCNHCGLSEWRGQPLVLELEHKDGVNTNDTRENLECICPNCHSLTKTWRGRNKANAATATDEEFITALRESPNIRQALGKLGLAQKGGNYKRAKRLLERM